MNNWKNLLETHPELCKEWDYDKNNFGPEMISRGSRKEVFWICAQGHNWKSSPHTRTNPCGKKCPRCPLNFFKNRANDDNRLSLKYSNLCKEWSPRNEYEPKNYSCNSGMRVWWMCSKNKQHEWQSVIRDRIRYNSGCPFCSGKFVHGSTCLKITHPRLCDEWDYEKNILTPEEVTKGSGKFIWWKCSANSNHSWRSKVDTRTTGNRGCPYCSGNKVCDDNCLQNNASKSLLDEWDCQKNGSLTPKDVTKCSHTKVFWKCKKGHSWFATVNSRNPNKSGCPICNESRGERKIRTWFEDKKIEFSSQVKFEDLKLQRCLKYDFCVKIGRKIALIEYDGEQHFEFRLKNKFVKTEKEFRYLQRKDKLKTKYCNKNGYFFLRITYLHFNSIGTILTYFFKIINYEGIKPLNIFSNVNMYKNHLSVCRNLTLDFDGE